MKANLTESQVAFFQELLPAGTLINSEQLFEYGHDETEDLSYPPAIVLKPTSVSEISEIMRYCHAEKIPVTPAGARTGLSGGSLPIHGGVLLSMEKFNKILKFELFKFLKMKVRKCLTRCSPNVATCCPIIECWLLQIQSYLPRTTHSIHG
jgi:hypothetical protein